MNDSINLVVIPNEVHKHLHTKSYYEYINTRLKEAYVEGGALEENRMRIDAVMVELQWEIINYCETNVAPWVS